MPLCRGDQQVPCVVEVKVFAGWDDGSGTVFGDDGGAGIFLAGAEVVAGVKLRGEMHAVELH